MAYGFQDVMNIVITKMKCFVLFFTYYPALYGDTEAKYKHFHEQKKKTKKTVQFSDGARRLELASLDVII